MDSFMFEARYLNPLTDFGFHRVFGNKELLINFLNEIIKEEGLITDIDYLQAEQQGDLESNRRAIFDIYCTTEKGDYFIVEMQKARQPHFRDRCLYYTSFPIQKRAPRGVKLFPLKAVYLVAVLEFVLFNENEEDKERVINSVHLVRDETKTRFSDKLNMVFVELPKFKKTEQELQNNADNWLFSLRNMSKMDKLPEKLKGEIFEQLFEIAEIKRLTKEDDMEAYRKSILDYEDVRSAVDLAFEEGREEALKEGEERGLVKGREEGEERGREGANETFVQKSLQMGLPINIIINLTGYSEEQILRLKNKEVLTDM